MIDLLNELTKYLAPKVSLVAGTSIFFNEMPEIPDRCVVIQELRPLDTVPPQVNAEVHLIRVTARDVSNVAAKQLASNCYRWLLTDLPEYNEDSDITGFLTLLNDLSVNVQLNMTPMWDKTDSTGRKYFYFTATIITKRLI